MIGSARRVVKTMWNRDPLLAAARLALGAAMATSAFLTAAFVIATPSVLIMNESVMATLADHGGPPETIWAVISVIALSGVTVSMTPKGRDQLSNRPRGGFEFSFSGLLLARVLFVLARVSREGARLREEVEGTV